MPRHRAVYRKTNHAASYGNLCRGHARGIQHHKAFLLAARARTKGRSGEMRHEGIFVAQDVARRSHVPRKVLVAFARHGNHTVADKIAQIRRILVALVFPPSDARHFKIPAKLLVREVDERAHDDVPTARNARESRGARALDGVHEERLSSVACRVRGHDARRGARAPRLLAEFANVPPSGRIAHLSCGSFEILAVELGERCVFHTQGNPIALAEAANMLLVCVGRLPAEMMVYMEHVDALSSYARRAPTVHDVELRRARHDQKRR